MVATAVHDFTAAPRAKLHAAYGRTMPVHNTYPLPTDSEEHNRLDIQHTIYTIVIGGLYTVPGLVHAALEPKAGRVPRILDVGTGSGAWAIEMARKFPQCEVIGIDLVPPTLLPSHPPNLRFQAGDLNLPLALKTSSVDFIHARMVDHGIENYPKWLSEAGRILRPNGLYLVIQGTARMVRSDGTDLPNVPAGARGYTGFQSMVSAIHDRALSRCSGKVPADHWIRWMKEDGNFDRTSRLEDKLCPIGAWPDGMDDNRRLASELMRQNFLALVMAWKPALIGHGHNEAIVDRWIKDATLELSELRIKASARWSSAWCLRSTDEWKPYSAK